MEHHQATESMKKFFENLLEVKAFIKKKYDETHNNDLKEVYEKLNHVIKSTEDEQNE